MKNSLRALLCAVIITSFSISHTATEAEARELYRQLKEQYPHTKIVSYESYVQNYGGPYIFYESDTTPIAAYYGYLQATAARLPLMSEEEDEEAKQQELVSETAQAMAQAVAAQEHCAATAAQVAESASRLADAAVHAQQLVNALGGHALL